MELTTSNKVSVGKTKSVDVCQHGTFERQMCLQLPEERPFLRRSTSPTIVLPGEDDHSLGSSISPSNSNSPGASRRSSSSRKNSGSRKNSFVSCLSPNVSPPLSPEYSPSTDTKNNFLSPTNTFNLPKSKVKLLKKTASVKQLYLSVLQALRTISGTKDDIMPELTKTFFEKVLRDFEQNQTLQVTKVKVKDGKEFGRHFCSEVHAVEVTVKLKDASKEFVETYQLIIKSQPLSEDARKFLQPNHTFEKEVQMYSTVFVDMANFVKKQGVIPFDYHESEIVDIPKCFYARWSADSQVKDDMIVMENLIPKGFVFIAHGDMEINKLHVNLAIREIAKFHAISFCMKNGSNQYLIDKYRLLAKDSLYRKDTYEFTNRTLTPVMASLAELIRSTPLYSDNYEWFIELAKNFHWIQTRMVEPTDKFGVICHGDLWWSNILFRYESDENQDKEESISARPREVKFIDFQSARISSLVTDILAFTFTSLSSTLRREHIYQLLEVRLFFQRPIEYSELNLNLKSNFLNTSPQWNAYIIKKDKRIFL